MSKNKEELNGMLGEVKEIFANIRWEKTCDLRLVTKVVRLNSGKLQKYTTIQQKSVNEKGDSRWENLPEVKNYDV